MEASCAVVRVVQAFPGLRFAEGVRNEAVGRERQVYTIVAFPYWAQLTARTPTPSIPNASVEHMGGRDMHRPIECRRA
jgi:hypothetical protein